MSLSTRPANDPVSQAVLRSATSSGRYPVPLVKSDYDISIRGGLVDVVARRTFHNGETLSLEATLTFPIPVHAVLYHLEARIGGRVVKGLAKSRQQARETYEDALDRGKSAVLHEELIRGVHMLSVGHIAPGTEIDVTVRFAVALSWIGGRALLRIPTTVGDVYGSSGLPDSDDLVHGGPVLAANVTIRCDCGTASLRGATLENGSARARLDAPIDIEVEKWLPRDLSGTPAGARGVSLAIRPAPGARGHLDCAVLVDHSGSMGEPCAGNARLNKHAAVLLGLTEAADDLTESDRLNLWEFDTSVSDLGTAHASTWRSLLRSLSGPAGGTEIGGAIAALLAQRPVRDVLIITDGKSHALDVQQLAGRGVRFTVVLIGEDSLEANVGHLASISGGEIFIPDGADVTGAVRSALRSLRAPRPAKSETSGGCAIAVARAGMAISASWSGEAAGGEAREHRDDRAVSAYAASLRIATLPSDEAARLAEAEGLVTHLTSLVLVDEEGVTQAGVPAARKVALPSPVSSRAAARMQLMYDLGSPADFSHGRSRAVHCMAIRPSRSVSYAERHGDRRSPPDSKVRCSLSPRDEEARRRALELLGAVGESDESACIGEQVLAEAAAPVSADDAPQVSRIRSRAHLLRRIDWREEGQRLAEGNMIGLPTDIADAIDEAAAYGVVRRAAKRLGLAPRTLVIGLIARAEAGHNRHADRVARAIFAKAKPKYIAALAERLGLEPRRVGA